MNPIIEFQTDDGVILIETTEKVAGGGRTSIGAGDKAYEKAKDKFGDALDTLEKVASNVVRKVRAIGESPHEVEVKLGLKFTAEAGAIIARTSAEGNLEVTLKWTKPEKPQTTIPPHA
jgi:hypothetical protein